jgi:ubiquinone/menaquinone biosynthesis C-methylase UbiE
VKDYLHSLLECQDCKISGENYISNECNTCESNLKSTTGVLTFIDGKYHSNFGYQWNKFSKVQLDSFNGSDESESRLLSQSNLTLKDFKGKVVLEVGAGNGRFTELLLKYGAKVIAVDYSTAIEANYKNNSSKDNEVIFMQADLFNLPIKKMFLI